MTTQESREAEHAKANAANAEFWNEMCGSQLARVLGIVDRSSESLRRFDDWYFDFYPYLFDHIPFGQMAGKPVLEVGLGYGTVAQRIASSGARYHGLDVAAGPVEFVNHRLHQAGLPGRAVQGSVFEAPFDDESFDYIVAIGCYHHTGDLARAVDESYRMLKPGGQLVFAVYYAYSYRRWQFAPLSTGITYLRERFGWRLQRRQRSAERAAYDTNAAGTAAPITEFASRRRLEAVCRRFESTTMTLENAAPEGLFRYFKRKTLLASALPRVAGLDVYVSAKKG